MTRSIDIHWLQAEEGKDGATMEHLTKMINDVYEAAEGDLWRKKQDRTSAKDMQVFTERGEVAVALVGDEIVGTVRIYKISSKIAEFGMLAVSLDYQGNGIGRKLINFAEKMSRANNFQLMQLKLFVPIEGTHPTKVVLEDWYERLGYRPIRTEPIELPLPHLVTPCQFIIFQKDLNV